MLVRFGMSVQRFRAIALAVGKSSRSQRGNCFRRIHRDPASPDRVGRMVGEANGDEPFNGQLGDKTQVVEKAVDDSIGVSGISGFFSRVRNKTKCRRFSA